MKKIICIILCLAFPFSAFAASDLDIMVFGHNQYCCICAAKEITVEPIIDSKTGNATYYLTDNLVDVFFVNEGKVPGFGCVCKDPAEEIEFLAQCITACYNFAGDNAVKNCYDVILSQFMFARSGNPLESTSIIPNVLVHIGKESFGYVFTLVGGN